jgi:hypothetical protein
MTETQKVYPVGYFETMKCLKDPKGWDVAGLVHDIREYTRRELDVPHGQALAVIDYLVERQSNDFVRELVVACKIALASLRHGGINGRSPETDTLQAAIKRAEELGY